MSACIQTCTYQYFNFKGWYKIFRHYKLCLENLETSTVPTPLSTLDPRVIHPNFDQIKQMLVLTELFALFLPWEKNAWNSSPKIHIQILQTDLHTFLLTIVERIWFKIKVFSFNLVIYLLFTLIDLLMLLGENWSWPLLGPKGLSLH